MAEETLGQSIEVNTNKQILSSETRIFKTESFFYQTKKIANIDKFILKISESLLIIQGDIQKKYSENADTRTFMVSTLGKEFSFYIKFGFNVKNVDGVNESDIIFVGYENSGDVLRSNDQRVNAFLKINKIFNIVIRPVTYEILDAELKKIYYVSSSEFVNFPMLSPKQQELVELENQNVLVQGVAGSGKTNICISKIIFTACRGYTGKVLYTTFSRGLLIDTKGKVDIFKNNLKNFVEDYKNGRLVFTSKNHKKAIENRLGIYIVCDNETNLFKRLTEIIAFLENNVDYFLIEDIYKKFTNDEFEMSSEKVFTDKFLNNITNHQLKSRLQKIKDISYAVCYKEIYGMIFGSYTPGSNSDMLTLEEYRKRRENSFEKNDIETIYGIAKLYREFQKSQNLLDNNIISYKLLQNAQKIPKYSLSIIDEVQDFTEVNLNLLDKISVKMFAVGDALQMINPTYFSFAGLKRIMYKEDVTTVAELECNYRNNKKIVEMLDALGEINIKQFGTHSFVLSGESIDEGTLSTAVYSTDKTFLDKLKNQKFENFTILVNDSEEKQSLREVFKRQEILTISEIKGLERDTVLLYRVLSQNFDKWQKLEKFNVSHKEADENSVYRYYFNLFYVGVSRAKHNIFVFEDRPVQIFDEFFKDNFECLSGNDAYQKFTTVISKIEIDDDEIWERMEEFIKLGQFDNARFYAQKFEDSARMVQALEKIEAFEKFVFKGKPREAGIKLWKAGLLQDAKKQFEISGDTKLIEFLESLESRNNANLDADVVKFFCDFEDNEEAQKLIVETVLQDLESIRKKHQEIKNNLKKFKEKYHG